MLYLILLYGSYGEVPIITCLQKVTYLFILHSTKAYTHTYIQIHRFIYFLKSRNTYFFKFWITLKYWAIKYHFFVNSIILVFCNCYVWKTIWKFLRKLNIHLLHDSLGEFLVITHKITSLLQFKNVYMDINISFLTIAKSWNKPKCP